MKPLKNTIFCRSGLDQKSGNKLKTQDSGFRRNDDRADEALFFKPVLRI